MRVSFRIGLACLLASELIKVMSTPLTEQSQSLKERPSCHCTSGTLVFQGEYAQVSDPVPLCSPDVMHDFFSIRQNRQCLISAGNSSPSHVVEQVTPGVLRRLKEAAAQLNVTEPNECDDIFSIQTDGFRVPGLTVRSTAIVSSKLVMPINAEGNSGRDDADTYPRIESVAIEDKTEASGIKPCVWIFNQLTGFGKKERDGCHRTEVASVGLVSVKREEDKQLRFHTQASTLVQLHFPSVLLRILPVSKAAVERRGSRAVVKSIAHDVQRAMTKLCDEYSTSIGSISSPGPDG